MNPLFGGDQRMQMDGGFFRDFLCIMRLFGVGNIMTPASCRQSASSSSDVGMFIPTLGGWF